MAIPASTVVNVNISTTPQFPSRRGFGVLNILGTTQNVIPPVERIRFYSSILEVQEDFAEGTPEYAMALVYFSQQPKPVQLAISTQYSTDQPGQALGGGDLETLLATWNLIVDGSFNVSIDGDAQDISTLDFSLAVDLDAIATIVQTGLQTILTGGFASATCVIDKGRFIITSGTSGLTSTVSALSAAVAGTDISALMDMRPGRATLQSGFLAEADPVDSLAPILDKSTSWYGFGLDNVYSSTQIQAVAAAIEPLVNIMCYSSPDVTILDSGTTTDVASLLKASGYRRALGVVEPDPTQYPHISAFARLFTTDFTGIDTTITLKFKQLPGVSATPITTSQKKVTEDKNINIYTTIGGVDMFAEGVMASGAYADEVQGVDWLRSAIENNVFGYTFSRPTKVPLTDKGGASLEQQVIRALDEGVRNGLLGPGETIDGVFLANGYSVTVQPVAEISQADKDNRIGPVITFVALLTGAVHNIQINGTLER